MKPQSRLHLVKGHRVDELLQVVTLLKGEIKGAQQLACCHVEDCRSSSLVTHNSHHVLEWRVIVLSFVCHSPLLVHVPRESEVQFADEPILFQAKQGSKVALPVRSGFTLQLKLSWIDWHQERNYHWLPVS